MVGGVNVVLLIHNFGISLWLAFTLNDDNVPTWSNEAKSNSIRSLYARSRYSRSGKFFNLNNYNFTWLFDIIVKRYINFNNITWKASSVISFILLPRKLIYFNSFMFINALLSILSIALSSKFIIVNFGRSTNVWVWIVLIILNEKFTSSR